MFQRYYARYDAEISPIPVVAGPFPPQGSRKIAEYFSSVYELDYLGADDVERARILRNSNITAEADGVSTATVGGLLVFSEYPERYLPQAVVSVAVFNGISMGWGAVCR